MKLEISYHLPISHQNYYRGQWIYDDIELYVWEFYQDAIKIINNKSHKFAEIPYSCLDELFLYENKKELDHIGYETTTQELEDEFNQRHIAYDSLMGIKLTEKRFLQKIIQLCKDHSIQYEVNKNPLHIKS